jgi:acyl carrier protein
MNEQETLRRVVEQLLAVAPELEPATLRPERPLRQQVDLDSMDWLNFVIGLHKAFEIDIPEADYRSLDTLDAIVRYLMQRSG